MRENTLFGTIVSTPERVFQIFQKLVAQPTLRLNSKLNERHIKIVKRLGGLLSEIETLVWDFIDLLI